MKNMTRFVIFAVDAWSMCMTGNVPETDKPSLSDTDACAHWALRIGQKGTFFKSSIALRAVISANS